MHPPRAGMLTKVTQWAALLATVVLAGCGGGGSQSQSLPTPPGPTAVIFVSPPPASLAVNAAATLLAAPVFANSNTLGDRSVTWTVTCASQGACGDFGPNANAAAVTYTAPAAIPTGATVTVTARRTFRDGPMQAARTGSNSRRYPMLINRRLPVRENLLQPPPGDPRGREPFAHIFLPE
jgi:hypothetical protein